MSDVSKDGRGRSGEDRTRDYDAMQRDIRESQTRIDETIGALRKKAARLAPRHLMEQTMNRMHNTTSGGRDQRHHEGDSYRGGQSRGWTSSVTDTVRDNPVPLALIGLGLGWLALSGSGYDRRIARSSTMHSVRDRAGSAAQYARDTFYSATGSVRDAASSAYDSASDAVSGAYDRASDAVESATDSVRGMGGSMTGGNRNYGVGRSQSHMHGDSGHGRGMMSTERLHSATSRLWDMVDEHPLVAGVMGVALGAALGASIPSTSYENRWVGDYADEATNRAKELAQEAMDRGTRAARAAVEAAKDEVGDAVTAASAAAREEVNKPA